MSDDAPAPISKTETAIIFIASLLAILALIGAAAGWDLTPFWLAAPRRHPLN